MTNFIKFLTFLILFKGTLATPSPRSGTNLPVEILISEDIAPKPEGPAGTDLATAIKGNFYDDLRMLIRIYAPSLADFIETLQFENLWTLTMETFWRYMSLLFGWSMTERSGQSLFEEGPIFTLPLLQVDVTRDKLEGFVLDSLAVYRRWQQNEA